MLINLNLSSNASFLFKIIHKFLEFHDEIEVDFILLIEIYSHLFATFAKVNYFCNEIKIRYKRKYKIFVYIVVV